MNDNTHQNKYQNLLRFLNKEPIHIINLGLEKFAETYREKGINVIQVSWRPPNEIEDDLSAILDMIG